MRALLLLPVLLSGCTVFAAHDGTYLVTLKMKSDSCNEDNPSIGQEVQTLASLYRTNESLVLDLETYLLVGPPAEKDEFVVSFEQGVTTSFDGCDSSMEQQSFEIEGAFVPDLGFEGTATVSEREVRKACPDDEEEVCTAKFDVSAVRLNAATTRRPTGSIAWGYFPSGGGY